MKRIFIAQIPKPIRLLSLCKIVLLFVFWGNTIVWAQSLTNIGVQTVQPLVSLNKYFLRLRFHGDNLYISSYDNIYSVDVTAPTPHIETLYTANPRGPVYGQITPVIEGNFYIVNQSLRGEIVKVNATTNPVTATSLLTDVSDKSASLYGIALDKQRQMLYISVDDKLIKVNPNTQPPSRTTVISSGMRYGNALEVKGDYLYVLQPSKLSRINITSDTPTVTELATGLSGAAFGMAIDGNKVYISQQNRGNVLVYDLTQNSGTTQELVSGLSKPWGLAVKNGVLYIAEDTSEPYRRTTSSRISKFNLPTAAVSTESTSTPTISVGNFFNISEKIDVKAGDIYTIVNFKTQQEFIRYILPNDRRINTQNLTRGVIYFLRIGNAFSKKIVKQ